MVLYESSGPAHPVRFSVPGLDEKPPSGYDRSGLPNCYGCKDAPYATLGPLFSGCDGCEEDISNRLFSDEALLMLAEERQPERPQLGLDLAGGVFLPVLGRF